MHWIWGQLSGSGIMYIRHKAVPNDCSAGGGGVLGLIIECSVGDADLCLSRANHIILSFFIYLSAAYVSAESGTSTRRGKRGGNR